MWSDVRFVTTARVGFWIWNWSLIHCGLGSGLLLSMLGKFRFVHLIGLDRSVQDGKLSLKTLEFSFCSKLDLGAYIVSVTKTVPKKWNTAFMSGLVLLIGTEALAYCQHVTSPRLFYNFLFGRFVGEKIRGFVGGLFIGCMIFRSLFLDALGFFELLYN